MLLAKDVREINRKTFKLHKYREHDTVEKLVKELYENSFWFLSNFRIHRKQSSLSFLQLFHKIFPNALNLFFSVFMTQSDIEYFHFDISEQFVIDYMVQNIFETASWQIIVDVLVLGGTVVRMSWFWTWFAVLRHLPEQLTRRDRNVGVLLDFAHHLTDLIAVFATSRHTWLRAVHP